MQEIIEILVFFSGVLVPLLAVWAITCLFTLRSGNTCQATEAVYFVALLIVAGLTVRTMLANEACWLIHTASLGSMIVAGVMRRPTESSDAMGWKIADWT